MLLLISDPNGDVETINTGWPPQASFTGKENSQPYGKQQKIRDEVLIIQLAMVAQDIPERFKQTLRASLARIDAATWD